MIRFMSVVVFMEQPMGKQLKMAMEEYDMICPNCKKEYEPVLGERPNDGRLIQDQFPNANLMQREQLQTGICSDKCWDEFLGVGGPPDE